MVMSEIPDVIADCINTVSLSSRKHELLHDHDLFVRAEPSLQRDKNKKMKERKKKKLAQQHNPQKLSGWLPTSGTSCNVSSSLGQVDDIIAFRKMPTNFPLVEAGHKLESSMSDEATLAMEVERKQLRAVHSPRPTVDFDHRFIVAPMINQSDPPFRTLCLKYGATCAFTEMLYSNRIVHSKDYLRKRLQAADHTFFTQTGTDEGTNDQIEDINSASDDVEPCKNVQITRSHPNILQNVESVPAALYSSRPLIVQICGNDPATLSECVLKIAEQSKHCPIDAIDFNLGCPQDRAREGARRSLLGLLYFRY